MPHQVMDIGVASRIGRYSDASIVQPGLRWLFTSGNPGLPASGDLPQGIERQTELAWENSVLELEKAGMTVHDIVKVTQYLTRAEDVKTYAQIRNRFLGDACPASMLLVIPQLVWPEM